MMRLTSSKLALYKEALRLTALAYWMNLLPKGTAMSEAEAIQHYVEYWLEEARRRLDFLKER